MSTRASTRLQQRSVALSNVVSQTVDSENAHDMSDNENMDMDVDIAASSTNDGAIRRRGTTLMGEIWNLPPGRRIKVKFDKAGNSIGSMSGKLRRFIGTTARKCELAPIGYKSWKDMPTTNMDKIWIEIEKRFTIPPAMVRKIRRICLMICSSRWRAYKGTLKAEHFDIDTRTKDQITRDIPARVECTQWAMCVDNWTKDKKVISCAQNKINRGKQKLMHRVGTKSFPEVAAEMLEEDGEAPSRGQLILKAYTCKDGTFAGDAIAQAKMAAVKEKVSQNLESEKARADESIGWSNNDIISEVFGKEHNGRVRGAGKGAVPSEKSVNSQRGARGLDLTSVSATNQPNDELQELRASMALLQAQMNRFLAAQNGSGSNEAQATTSSERTPSIPRQANTSETGTSSHQGQV